MLRHFGKTKMELAAELHALSSLGDRTALDFLEHMHSLQPGEAETSLFRYIFLNAIPEHARTIVAHHEDLNDMAAAADVVLAAVPSVSAPPAAPLVVSALDDDDFGIAAAQLPTKTDSVAMVDGLCPVHKRFGKGAFSCTAPDKCRMRSVIRKKKQGNSQAGGQ